MSEYTRAREVWGIVCRVRVVAFIKGEVFVVLQRVMHRSWRSFKMDIWSSFKALGGLYSGGHGRRRRSWVAGPESEPLFAPPLRLQYSTGIDCVAPWSFRLIELVFAGGSVPESRYENFRTKLGFDNFDFVRPSIWLVAPICTWTSVWAIIRGSN